MINRGVVIVRPKQPYLDWATRLDDSGFVPDPNGRRPNGIRHTDVFPRRLTHLPFEGFALAS